MLIPIGDEPREPGTPWVNYALIAANVLAFVAFQGAGREPALERSMAYAYVPAAPSVSTAFTSMFLHAGWMHLLGNMLFLWIFGDNVEARLGRVGYLTAYLATGFAATLLHGAVDSASAIPGIGASGAISGVQGLYLVLFPRNRVKLFVAMYVMTVLHVQALWMILAWFVLQDLLPFLLQTSVLGGGVAHAAHLGGFAAGVLLALSLRPLAARVATDTHVGVLPGGVSARTPWASVDPYSAERRTRGSFPSRDVLTARPETVAAAPDAASRIQAFWDAGAYDQASTAFALALGTGRTLNLPEPSYLRICARLYERAHWDEARLGFEGFLRTYPNGRGAPVAAFGLGMILLRRDGDPEAARPYLERAGREHPDPAVRALALRELGYE